MNHSQPLDTPAGNITLGQPKMNLGHDHDPKQPQQSMNERGCESRRLGWYADSQRNSPQSNSLAAASFIFSSGGISLAASIGLGPNNNEFGAHVQFCWFIAVIIGACISTVLVHKIPKRVFYLVASVLVIVNGVLGIALTHNLTAIISARYCDGIAFGLTLIPAIVAGCEQSVSRFRGRVLSTEQLGLVVGVLLGVVLTTQRFDSILALIYGLIALICAFFCTIESPVFYLSKGNEIDAVNVLQKLQRPHIVTNETHALLHESKALLEEDLRRGRSNFSCSWIPMIKMILFRCFVSMSFSLPFNMVIVSENGIGTEAYLYLVMRMLGVIVAMFTLDTVGRRIPSALSLLVSGVLLFVAGLLGATEKFIILMIIYQVLSGIVAPTSTCYLGEAFSVSVKPYFILAAIMSENIMQIIVSCFISKGSIALVYCVLGGLQVVYGIVFFFTMPETKQTTLREALRLFKTILAPLKAKPKEDAAF